MKERIENWSRRIRSFKQKLERFVARVRGFVERVRAIKKRLGFLSPLKDMKYFVFMIMVIIVVYGFIAQLLGWV